MTSTLPFYPLELERERDRQTDRDRESVYVRKRKRKRERESGRGRGHNKWVSTRRIERAKHHLIFDYFRTCVIKRK